MDDYSQQLSVLKRHGYAKDAAMIFIMRLQLIKILNEEFSRRRWTQREAADVLGIAQPRIAELSALATDKFSIEALIKYLLRLDLKASLTVRPGKRYLKPKRQSRKITTRSGGDNNKKPNSKTS